MKLFKKGLALSLVALSTVSLLAGCGGKDDGKVTLTVASSQTKDEPSFKEFKKIAEEYSKENPDVKVEVTIPSDYEASMKTRMAGNDLPDLFFTHGWSVARYSEYLEPIQDRAWAADINPLIKDRITNKDDEIFILPMDVSVSGIIFNKKVIEKAGVDWQSIKTWDDFSSACKKVKDAGFTPIAVGGVRDSWTLGNLLDYTMPSFYTSNDSNNQRAALLDGSFDWKKEFPVYYDFLTGLYDNGYFNSNVQEGSNQDTIELIANDEAAFSFGGLSGYNSFYEINSNVEIGLMPLPVKDDTDEPFALSGENQALGVWKDSKNKKEALKFLDYLAKPENINRIAKTGTNPTGLVGDGYEAGTSKFNDYFDNLENYRTFGFFDRDYLPSGMWDTLCKAGETIVTKSGNEKDIAKTFQADYDKLIKQ